MDDRKDSEGDLDAQAADWVARVHDPEADGEAWLALETWLAGDPSRLAAFDRAERLWAEIGEVAGELPGQPEPLANVIPLPARRRSRAVWLAPAAGAIAAGVAGLVVFSQWPQTQVYETAPGEVREIALSDGSVVHLNGASKLTVRLGRRERTVEMEAAEAAFDVAKDSRRPFVVEVGESEVTVVGTEFNISRYAGSTSVAVRRGVVQVEPGSGAPVVRLTPGMRLEHKDGARASAVSTVPADTAFAWQGGHLIYQDAPLSQVAADLSRRFPIPVRAEGAAASLRFSGVLSLDEPDAVLRRIESFLPVKVHRGKDEITLTSR